MIIIVFPSLTVECCLCVNWLVIDLTFMAQGVFSEGVREILSNSVALARLIRQFLCTQRTHNQPANSCSTSERESQRIHCSMIDLWESVLCTSPMTRLLVCYVLSLSLEHEILSL